MARIDLTGKRFGRLTVLKRCGTYTYPSGNKRSKWLCKCDCGNICEVKSNSLKSGKKSCGCLEAENHKRFANENRDIDISGQRYGMLTAISKVGVTKSGAAWLCICDCGNERIVSIGDLRRKRYPTIDCGHHSGKYPASYIAQHTGYYGCLEKQLMNAYVNGYTVAKDKKYLVYKELGGKQKNKQVAQAYRSAVFPNAITWSIEGRESLSTRSTARFTESGIEHYGLQDCEKEEVTDDEQ